MHHCEFYRHVLYIWHADSQFSADASSLWYNPLTNDHPVKVNLGGACYLLDLDRVHLTIQGPLKTAILSDIILMQWFYPCSSLSQLWREITYKPELICAQGSHHKWPRNCYQHLRPLSHHTTPGDLQFRFVTGRSSSMAKPSCH